MIAIHFKQISEAVKKGMKQKVENKLPTLEKSLTKFKQDESVNILVEWINWLEFLRISKFYTAFTLYLICTVIAGPIVFPILFILGKLSSMIKSM